MNAVAYISVLEAGLKPFLSSAINVTKFMQDNDPKHTSRIVGDWMDDNNINWWRTPPESPDLNPIENVWHELKEYISRVVKPKVKAQLISGILEFWETVDNKCSRHLKKVVIELNGGPNRLLISQK